MMRKWQMKIRKAGMRKKSFSDSKKQTIEPQSFIAECQTSRMLGASCRKSEPPAIKIWVDHSQEACEMEMP